MEIPDIITLKYTSLSENDKIPAIADRTFSIPHYGEYAHYRLERFVFDGSELICQYEFFKLTPFNSLDY